MSLWQFGWSLVTDQAFIAVIVLFIVMIYLLSRHPWIIMLSIDDWCREIGRYFSSDHSEIGD